MNILIINPIVYTSESKNVVRTSSIKDTMIYDLCLAFHELGHTVTLYAGEPFRPENEEQYPFEVIWGECGLQKLFLVHCFPYLKDLPKYLKEKRSKLDLVISSEVFSINTLNAVRILKNKVIVWHELAKHNAKLKKIPSKIWYNIIARFFMRNTLVVARSQEARVFIGHYCKNVSDVVIDHGVNLDIFPAERNKENYFFICSQLIARKRIDGILYEFQKYVSLYDASAKLLIAGDGEQREFLEELAQKLDIATQVVFLGKLSHSQLIPYLSHAAALLINTEKDNSMISIVESISVGTPVVTTPVPLNARYIAQYELGIVAEWTWESLIKIVKNNSKYVERCLAYRECLSDQCKAKLFIDILKQNQNGMEGQYETSCDDRI